MTEQKVREEEKLKAKYVIPYLEDYLLPNIKK